MFKKRKKPTIQEQALLDKWKKRPLKYKIGDFLEYIAVVDAPRPLFKPPRRPKRKHGSLLALLTLIMPLIVVVFSGVVVLVRFIQGKPSDSFLYLLMAFFLFITLFVILENYFDFHDNLLEFLKRGFFQKKPKKWLIYFKSSITSKDFWKMPKE